MTRLPTLVLNVDDDQIVPIANSAMLSVKLVKTGTLKIYKDAPHGMCTTEKDKVNADVLAFIEGKRVEQAALLLLDLSRLARRPSLPGTHER